MEDSLNLFTTDRKIRKPLMERKRRARINKSLNELQQLLTETDFASRGTKLEKADILEMTVEFMKSIKHNCSKEIKENLENLLLERYFLGFEKCMEEIEQMVEDIPGLEVTLKQKLHKHLQGCLDAVKKQPISSSILAGSVVVNKLESDKQNGRKDVKTVLLQGPKDLRILPSKLPNGDVILLLSSDLVKCDKDLRKSSMWRPW